MMALVKCPPMLGRCLKTYNCCSFVSIDNINGKRSFSRTNVHQRRTSHYDSLGITPKATQTDVKAAYYKLSMVYHPDKNKGCVDAADKFRDINAAYEILGNFKLRRLYDKGRCFCLYSFDVKVKNATVFRPGIVHTAGPQYRDVDEPIVEEPDDPQTKFYKQHMQRTQKPHASGRTPIYNFDEWNNQHYGKAFERSQAARKKHRNRPTEEVREANSIKYEVLILGGMLGFTIFIYLMVLFDKENPDHVYRKER